MNHSQLLHIRSLLAFVLLSVISLTLLSCAEYDKGVGKNLVGGVEDGEIKEAFFPADDYTVYANGDVIKYSAAQLHLGEQDGFHSDMVLWFTSFTSFGEILEFDSAQVKLFSSGYVDADLIDEHGYPDWEAEVFRCDSLFNPIYEDYESAQSFQKTSIGTAMLGTNDGDLDSFVVNEFSIELDTLDLDTLLLYIQASDQAQFIKRFVPYSSSVDASYLPRLEASGTFAVDGDTLTDTTLVVYPLYTTWYTDDSDLMVDNSTMTMSQGYARELLFKGDFTIFDPSLHSMNRVDLVLTSNGDWDGSMGNATAVTWYDIAADWSADPDTVEYGNQSELAYFIPDTTSVVRFNITPVVKQWVALPETNFGVGIKSVLGGSAIARRGVYSNDASVDSTFRPYFHVVYTEFK